MHLLVVVDVADTYIVHYLSMLHRGIYNTHLSKKNKHDVVS